jgi:hypothetical protein
VARSLRHLIADPNERRSIGTHLRAKRWRVFGQQFPDIARMRVLDLGGTTKHWETSPLRPQSVVVVNLQPYVSDADWIAAVQGDACAVPDEVRRQDFDLVYSNSLIEHLGGHARRATFADQVRSLAPRHWVQTPYRYFPIEPHWLFPGLQFMSPNLRAKAIQVWPLSPAKPRGRAALGAVLGVELLSVTEMRYYFGDSKVLRERVAGLTKSLIAVK